MRRSGWLLPIFAFIAWAASVAYPALVVINRIMAMPGTEVEIRRPLALLGTSVGWSAMVAIGAMLIGWSPGRVLGRALHHRNGGGGRGFVPLATLMLVPICLPAYVVFYAWWQSWPADGAIFRWLVQHDQVQLGRRITLLLALLCWSWPLVSWCVAGTVAATPAEREELLRLDGAGPLRRGLDHLRCDFRGLAVGGLLAFLATLANTTCFDLAEVFTFANELRAVQALGANARDVLAAGWPAMVIGTAGALAAWMLLANRPREAARRAGKGAASTRFLVAAIWLVSALLPVVLFASTILGGNAAQGMIGEFVNLYGRSVIQTLALAAISGMLCGLIAIGLSAAWQDHRRWVRGAASVMALGWLFAAVMPATITAMALEAAYNRNPMDRLVYDSPMILVIAHLAAFGFVPALLARWMARREPAQVSDLRRLDGAQTLRGLVESSWPRLLAAALATAAVVFVLALGEIPITAMVNPPHRAGAGPLALHLLNAMHYQRPQTVMIATLGMLALAGLTAIIVAATLWQVRSILGSNPQSTNQKAQTDE